MENCVTHYFKKTVSDDVFNLWNSTCSQNIAKIMPKNTTCLKWYEINIFVELFWFTVFLILDHILWVSCAQWGDNGSIQIVIRPNFWSAQIYDQFGTQKTVGALMLQGL